MSGPTPPPPAVTITSIVPGNDALSVYYTGGALPYMTYQADGNTSPPTLIYYAGGVSPIRIYSSNTTTLANGTTLSVLINTYQHINADGSGPLVANGVTPSTNTLSGTAGSTINFILTPSVSIASSSGQLIVTFDKALNNPSTTRYQIEADDGTNPPIVTGYLTNSQIPATSSGLTPNIPYTITIKAYSFVAPSTYTLIDTFTFPTTYTPGEPQLKSAAVCYARGTLIGTDRGMIPIEEIRLSDKLRTYDCIKETTFKPVGGIPFKTLTRVEDTRFKNRFANIKFIGNFSVNRMNEMTAPIRITKNALGHLKPEIDLLVSPNHSMLIGDRLIFAKNLVNGSTIYQDMSFETIEYYHILSDDHYIINANGAMSETLGTEELKLFETMIYAQSQVYKPLALDNKFHLQDIAT
jgi:hypothetical protein